MDGRVTKDGHEDVLVSECRFEWDISNTALSADMSHD